MSAIWLIRHGQASFHADDYDDLSPLGERQARMLGASLKQRGVQPTGVYCGAMRRHQQTAAACLAELGIEPKWIVDAGWNEYDHNDVLQQYDARYSSQRVLAAEMATHHAPQATFVKVFSAAVSRWTEGRNDADYRESWLAFNRRVVAALERVKRQLNPHQAVLVFTSGGVISAVCRELLGLDDAHAWALNLRIANASTTKLLQGQQGLYLSCLNDHAHLEQAQAQDGTQWVSYF
ncbi:MAG: histidine phosphatase family protein [Sinobacteraceae bacterium]|nr:histidine phosphatase family protein [Nevskiaceae bacterium]